MFKASRVVASGKADLAGAIGEFFAKNNVKSSNVFSERLADHIKRHIISSLERDGRFALRGLGALSVV